MLREHTIEFRVRYQETDAQGRVHHANYATWYEMGRVELLRAMGYSYREFEATGLLLVIAEMHCKYYLPASYDDVLSLTTRTVRGKGARIEHHYGLRLGDTLLAEATSVVACIDRTGKVRRLPEWLRTE